MKVKSKIELTFENEETAKIIYDTLEVDNKNFVESAFAENTITYVINNHSLSTTLATIDDLIVCEILSEKIVNMNNE